VARATLAAPAPPVMSLPDLFDALAGVDALEIPIGGWAGAPEELQVDVSEGRATIERVEQGLVVVLRPEALVHPRWILVAVRDRRSESAPVVARVRVRSRPRLPLQVEPGVTLSLEVGGRQYGPFVASETGSIDGRVDQYPGEGAATAVLTDRLGNTTRTEIPLVVDGEPTLVGSSGLELLPGRPPPTFHVAAVQAGGGWSADAPTCRAPFGAVPVRQEAPGTWFGALPALVEPQDLRVLCTLGGRQAVIRIPVAPVPARLSLRVWPQDLRADFPTAEVRVALEDWRGERLPVDRVSLSAVRGHVEPLGGGGVVGLAEYDGATAVAAGRDTVTATYRPPPGVGPVVEVELSWSAVSAAGVTLGARALDARRRPVAGAALRLWAGGDAQDVVTDGDGAASAVLAHDTSDGPVTVGADWTEGGARVRSQRGAAVAPRGRRAAPRRRTSWRPPSCRCGRGAWPASTSTSTLRSCGPARGLRRGWWCGWRTGSGSPSPTSRSTWWSPKGRSATCSSARTARSWPSTPRCPPRSAGRWRSRRRRPPSTRAPGWSSSRRWSGPHSGRGSAPRPGSGPA
jgi:hypothetical protein